MSTSATLADPPADQAFDAPHVVDLDASGSPSGRRGSWRSRLPPLPQQRSPLVRSSSPRHHSSASSAAARPTPSTTNPPSPSPFSTPNRRRRQSPSARQTPVFDGEVDLTNAWGDDSVEVSLVAPTEPVPVLPDFSESQILDDLFEGSFSSPSDYPSFLNTPAGVASQAGQAPSQPQVDAAEHPGSAAPPRRSSACERPVAAPSRSTTQLSASSLGDSQNTLFTNEFGEDLLSSDSTQSSFVEMPPPRLHDTTAQPPKDAPAAKRRRVNGEPNGNSTPLALPQPSDDDVFGDNNDDDPELEQLTTIDLTEANGVLEELKKPEVDKRIKLSAFQCVICMDDVSTLTVTHCGHLYCQQCLHSSLHVEATKGKCPMCRAKIDMKPRSSYNTKTKGFWPLELKLMTATKKGKRKADDLS